MNKEEILSKIKEEALLNHVPILMDESMNLIEVILKLKKPNKILEVGSAVGYSAICFSKYLTGENSKIRTIELNEERFRVAVSNINKMQLEDKIEIINADATKYLATIPDDEKYDVCFIDAAKGQYNVFLEQALRLTKSGGIIIADNVLWKGRVLGEYNEHRHRTAVTRLRTYLKTISENDKLESKVFNIGDGVAVSFVK
ncbi:o-methyltransferase family 3 [Clostridium sp. CAG:1219]|nr:o-methyltransferase family 3 [Clostridium sp. CAG:1219]